MPSPCCPLNWAFVVVIYVGDALFGFSSAAVWGTGIVEKILLGMMNDTELLEVGAENFHVHMSSLALASSVLYSLTGISSMIAALGVMSGFYELQIHHLIISFIRFVGTIFICELVISIQYNTFIYVCSRIILYGCGFLNLVLLFVIYASLAAEYQRCMEEIDGQVEPEIRPLTLLFSRCLGSRSRSSLCRRRPSSSEDALEVNFDATDGQVSSGNNLNLPKQDLHPSPAPGRRQESLARSVTEDLEASDFQEHVDGRSDHVNVANDGEHRTPAAETDSQTSRGSQTDEESQRDEQEDPLVRG
ncbi:uncharacterized protein LOC108681147 [Hyalella azteca]|uniref:Uncharacterized protein LOC108681147 n=1 Tax=Hyalella azteca TaxID=294128 RepID=A0A8B7PJT4_HYAAZ|nr:uncharacterized protein LOC108681147 [Hyalella azteca]